MTYSNGLGNLQNLIGTTATTTTETRRPEATNPAIEAATTSTRGADQTQLSTSGNLLGQALSAPDARMPRVLALSAAINAGSYQVSSQDVAGKMIESLLG